MSLMVGAALSAVNYVRLILMYPGNETALTVALALFVTVLLPRPSAVFCPWPPSWSTRIRPLWPPPHHHHCGRHLPGGVLQHRLRAAADLTVRSPQGPAGRHLGGGCSGWPRTIPGWSLIVWTIESKGRYGAVRTSCIWRWGFNRHRHSAQLREGDQLYRVSVPYAEMAGPQDADGEPDRDGDTSRELLHRLGQPWFQSWVRRADLITVSIGGNNVMRAASIPGFTSVRVPKRRPAWVFSAPTGTKLSSGCGP